MSPGGEIDAASFERAIGIYLDHAYAAGGRRPEVKIPFASNPTLDEVLASFVKDKNAGMMRRYLLRLGNAWYPHMKLAFQELLIKDRFFFAVDSHDDVAVDRSLVDFQAWLDLKQKNQAIKGEIEAAWQEAGLPTFASVVAAIEQETEPVPGVGAEGRGQSVLVVDDEVRIGDTVAGILRRHGYRVRRVDSAEAALEALSEVRFDLVLSDLEMGAMSGLDLARKLKASDETSGIPFILATAAQGVDQAMMEQVVDAFLRKPYDSALLLRFVRTYLPAPGQEPGSGETLT